MVKLYLINNDKNGSNSLYNLGLYYQMDKKYEEMKKYYSMAIDKENVDAMCNLGVYYYNIKKIMIT